MRLKGKTALVVGASRNIGKEIAHTFAQEGADLILVARKTKDDLLEVAKECEALGVEVQPLVADVASHTEVNDLVQAGMSRFGKIDVMVNCAAIRPHKPFWEIDYDEWHKVMAVNLHSTFYLAKALAPSWMKRQQAGSIVVLGGVASLTAQPRRAHVVTSKTGPLRRLGTPSEVASVARFLASDESSFVTGDRIVCAGGRYM
jgi:3-oxoacyl-[acyl-carrier protein] reductase